ncbi:MAG: TerB family tellurite resistance protein, partial [Pseudomonadota bacterium]
EAINDVRGAFRRGKWSRKIDQRLIESLDDPREAAAVLMYQVADYDGAVTDAQKAAIVDQMRTVFDADEETAHGLYAVGRMAVGQINDAGNNLSKILRPVKDMCTDEERQQLIGMLDAVSAVEGSATDAQKRLISEAQRILLPA